MVTSHRIGIIHAVRLGLILSLSLLWILTNAEPSHACSCRPSPPSVALANSPSVFAGRIISIEYPEVEDPWGRRNGKTEVIGFDVSSVWKGPRYKNIYLKSTLHRTDCNFPHWGFYQRSGDELLIYAREDFSVFLCSRILTLDEAQEDIDLLGRGRKPQSGTSGPLPGTPEFPPQQSPDTEWVDPANAGCSLGSATADATWLGIMAGLVWFGVRRRPRS